MTDFQVADLISKHILKKLTKAEAIKLNDWVQENDSNRSKFEELTNLDLLMKKVSIFFSVEEANTTATSIPINNKE